MRALIILAALAAAGCTTPSESAPPPRSLAGTSWSLETIDGAPPVQGSQPTIEFAAEGRASGDSSCNRFTGGWSQSRQHLTFDKMASTRKACMPPVDAQETRFLKALEGSVAYKQYSGRLWLEGGGVKLAFRSNDAGRTVAFDCGDGDRISVTFVDDLTRLTDPQGHVHELRQQPAASGIWYEGHGQTLRGKGREMTWSVGRTPPRTCREAG